MINLSVPIHQTQEHTENRTRVVQIDGRGLSAKCEADEVVQCHDPLGPREAIMEHSKADGQGPSAGTVGGNNRLPRPACIIPQDGTPNHPQKTAILPTGNRFSFGHPNGTPLLDK